MPITPNALDILIHYYVSPKQHPRFDAPAVQESIKEFCQKGILKQNNESFITTDKGKAWIEMILETPYPIQKFINPLTGQEIL
jgi:hypothetical protein